MKLNRIKEFLDKERRSQSWLAKEINISRGTVSKLCKPESNVSIQRIYEIAEALGVSPCDLLIEPKKEE